MRYPVALPTLRQTLSCAAAAAALMCYGPALALPGSVVGTQVSTGGAQPTVQTGSGTMTVGVNAARTIMDWSSYNIGAGETVTYTFGQRNWIALNRVTNGAISVNGTLRAQDTTGAVGGNIWLYSPQGVAFGGGARVDVGGLLATSASVDTTAFLNPTNLNMPFTGSGSGGSVTVAGGAQFNGKGYLAFVAPIVTTAAGATINAGDYGTAAYGAVDSYEIRFRPAFNNDLTFFTFLVPNGAAGTPHDSPLNLAGATTAANTYLIAISRAALTSVLINAPGLLTGQSSFNEYGQVTITTGRNITEGQIDATNSTPVPGARSGLVQLGEINASGNVNIVVSGRFGTSDLMANKIRAGQGLLIAARDITIGSGGIVSGNSNVNFGSTIIDTLGVVTIPALTARTDVIFQTGALQAGGPDLLPTLRLGTVTAGTRFSSIAETLNVSSLTAPSIQSSTQSGTVAGSLIGSTEVLVAATTSLSVGSVQTSGLTRLTAQDFTFTGPINADTAVLRILTPTQAVVGGTGTDRRVSNATLQRFNVRTSLTIQGGIDGQFPVANDLIVDDLDIDPAKIPRLILTTKTTNNITIRGTVAPTAKGVVLQIGDPTPDSIWKPAQIIVTGALGSAKGDALAGFTEVRAFDRIEMLAAKDILIGSRRFIDLVSPVDAAQIDIGQGLPAGVAPTTDEIGKLFLVSGSLKATAAGRIVQQNTGALGQQGGFYLTGDGVDAKDPLLTIGGAQIADMFGALKIGDGIVTTGTQAAISSRIARADGDTSLGAIRINGCALGVGCSVFTPATTFRISSFRPAAPRAAIDPPILTPPPPVDEDERETEAVVTGTGNEEIWRERK